LAEKLEPKLAQRKRTGTEKTLPDGVRAKKLLKGKGTLRPKQNCVSRRSHPSAKGEGKVCAPALNGDLRRDKIGALINGGKGVGVRKARRVKRGEQKKRAEERVEPVQV